LCLDRQHQQQIEKAPYEKVTQKVHCATSSL
jgi:hypothetical protein